MTDEQIKQNAEAYILPLKVLPGADENITFIAAIREAYLAGAHSRDEEIAELKEEIESLKENEKELFEGFKKRGTKLGELMKENVKLRNPWISVKERLPNDGEKVNVAIRWVHGEILYDSDVYHEDTGWEGYDNDDVIAWMSIPELKKGE